MLAAVLAAPLVARAQGKYPERPIKIIVPYPPGGGVDLTARLLMEPLSKELGQPIMVENKGGAGGIIGVEAMSHAPPDGYTLSLTGVSSLSAGPHMRKMPFDPMAFAHITRLVRMPLIVAVRNDLPARRCPSSWISPGARRSAGPRAASAPASTWPANILPRCPD